MNMIIKYGVFIFCLQFLFCDSVRSFLLSENEEIEMGNKFRAQIVSDTVGYPPYRGNPNVSKYVDSLGRLIASSQNDWSSSKVNYTFTVIDDDTMINAFAVPGGHVFLYTGLLLAATNEAQVAGVLAHEIAHISKHHSADALVKQNAVSLVNQVIFGNEESSLTAVISILENLTFLKFSRENENEADSLSVIYTSQAGMNPQGMSEFLGILKSKYGDSRRLLEPFEKLVSSHPLTSERITNVNNIISKKAPDAVLRDKKAVQYLTIRNLIN